MGIGLQYKSKEQIIKEHIVNDVPYLEFPLLSETGIVRHGFSTRLGGVSTGVCSSMNLSFSRGDQEAAVKENFRRIADAIGVAYDSMVFSRQTHTTNVRVVKAEDRGKGITRSLDYDEVDGMITNEPGICLATFYADCVPLFFVDPVNRAIGLTHSGWRGTVGKIGRETLAVMEREYGTRPENVRAAIGPSICRDCYEVSEDVIEQFRLHFSEVVWSELFYAKVNGKYQLNLWKANEYILRDCGIKREHLAVTNLCTCCNERLLFSHRASQGKRGNLGAFLALKEV
ncbi:MAG: peptidoglycan editing factor PgeF [Lachnospiraceae bacterium]